MSSTVNLASAGDVVLGLITTINENRAYLSEIDGLIVTKLDGTAKGGAVFAICHGLKVPVAFVGTGEAKEDIEEFNLARFIDTFFKV